MNQIQEEEIIGFKMELCRKERSPATIQRYYNEIINLKNWLEGKPLTKIHLLEYRDYMLIHKKVQTVNVCLSAINSFLEFIGCKDMKLQLLKVQRKHFIEDNRELSKAEYHRLLNEANKQKNKRLYYVMLTLCSTGIRVGELKFISVEAIKNGFAEIKMKGKFRTILLSKQLCKKLMIYAQEKEIKSGCLFCTQNGRPLDRSNIAHAMKKLCKSAGVNERKVFPHNLRHLFARCFISIEKNIAYLADILGHSRLETTRLYTMKSAKSYYKILNQMNLVI